MEVDWKTACGIALGLLLVQVTVLLPLWVTLGFLCYAIRKRRFEIGFLLILVTTEAVSFAVSRGTLLLLARVHEQ